MADRPILFSAPMVRALLDSTKTQTRRALKPQPVCHVGAVPSFSWGRYGGLYPDDWFGYGSEIDGALPYRPGDRLWVRESGQLLREAYDHDPRCGEDVWRDAGFYHSADGEIIEARSYDPPLRDWIDDCAKVSRPSIHMPRWASRLTLTVTDVRVQRLNEITDEDAFAEGVEPGFGGGPIVEDYLCLWNSIHGPFAADANPWVAAYTFTVERQNIDMESPHV